jgi:hypothetical protein
MRRREAPVYVVLADLVDQQYRHVRPARRALGLDPDEAPIEPVREVEFRFSRKLGRFQPCRPGAGTIRQWVDAGGRVTLAVHQAGTTAFDSDPVRVGWTLGVPGSSHDPAEVVAFLDLEASRRRQARS